MPPLRLQPADRLDGATKFSGDDIISGSLNVVRLLKSQRWVWNDLQLACELSKGWGRERNDGNWELAVVAFVVSGHVDLQPWLTSTTGDLWRECGFDARPQYRTAYRRMRELESVADAFLDAVAALVQHAKRHDKRVGAHVHFDGTEDETHAALVHDCPRGQCPRGPRSGHASGRGRSGAGHRPARQDTKTFREERQDLNALDPEQAARREADRAPTRTELVRRGGRIVKRLMVGGCWYRTLDVDAGIRAYMGPRGAKRFWHGYYNQKSICHFTGGVLFPGIYSASGQEYNLFDDVYDNTTRIIGEPAESAIGDKGYSVASVFKKCTVNGTAPIFAWRPGGGDAKRHDKDTHDRHGVVRCKHCGGPTHFVRFDAGDQSRPEDERNPRLWAMCMLGLEAGCAKEQTISCKTDWRLLVSLWRTDPVYHELKESHGSYESTHDWWRDRYKVAAADISIRPKIRGIGWHRLRANAAALVEWLRICSREGWLASARRNGGQAARGFADRGRRIADKLAGMRVRMGVAAAYGEKAALLGHGQRTPPSRRPRGAPPGQTTLDLDIAS
jgi:hypothetical protein